MTRGGRSAPAIGSSPSCSDSAPRRRPGRGGVATLGFTALLLADMRWVRADALRIALAVLLLVSFTVLAWIKTDGGWHWRWGAREEK